MSNEYKEHILSEIKELVCRENEGKDLSSMIETIASFWSHYLETFITRNDVVALLLMLKAAKRDFSRQDLLDIASYAVVSIEEQDYDNAVENDEEREDD